MSLEENLIFLSVIMPVYNEEHCVRESIRRIQAFMALKGRPWELIIVSDGSTDETDRLVAAAAASDPCVKLLVSEENRGKGATVRRGVLAAQGQFILVTDADLAAPIKEVEKLLDTLNAGSAIAIGSRAVCKKGREPLLAAPAYRQAGVRPGPWSAPSSPGCDVQQSFSRALSGRIFNWLVRLLVIRGFKDTQCGFKCFKREAALPLFKAQRLDGFSFDVEVLLLAVRQGFKVKEVPVMWRAGEKSQVRIFRDAVRMVKELFLIRKIYQ